MDDVSSGSRTQHPASGHPASSLASFRLSRRDALKLTAFGTAALSFPLIGSVSAKGVSELSANLLPRPYVLQDGFPEPPVIRMGPGLGGPSSVTIRQVQ